MSHSDTVPSAQAFGRFFVFAPDALCMLDFDSTFRCCNPAWHHMLGYPEDVMPATSFHDLVHPDDREATRAALATLTAGSDTATFVIRYCAAHGDYRWLEWRARADHEELSIYASARDITAAKAADTRTQLFEALVENAPDGFAVADPDGILIYLNPAFRALLGYASSPIGMRMAQLHTDAEQARIPTIIQHARDNGAWQGVMAYRRTDGSVFDAQLSVFLVRDAAGRPVAQVKIARDLSDQQRAEQERVALQNQIIAAQQDALRELSTPLISLTDDIVVMPLIGSIDSARAGQVMEGLLQGVAAHAARVAILDITGVPVVDTQIANVLLQAAQAVRLLGATVMITGIRPEVAQTLVGLGVDLSGIRTQSSLQMGITAALAR